MHPELVEGWRFDRLRDRAPDTFAVYPVTRRAHGLEFTRGFTDEPLAAHSATGAAIRARPEPVEGWKLVLAAAPNAQVQRQELISWTFHYNRQIDRHGMRSELRDIHRRLKCGQASRR